MKPIRDFIKSENLMHVLQHDITQRQIMMKINQLAQANLFQNQIRLLIIPCPPLSEQHRIISMLASADDRIIREELYRSKLLSQKKGLMADLLTGRIRVPVRIEENIA